MTHAEMIAFIMDNFAIFMMVLSLLVFATNVIVEVVKKMLPKLPTDLLVFPVAVIVTEFALYLWGATTSIVIPVHYYIAAVLLGFFVAYAAMFGFQKFKELYERLQTIKNP